MSFLRFLGVMSRLTSLANRRDDVQRLIKQHNNRSLLLEVLDEKGRNFAHLKVGPQGVEVNPLNKSATIKASGHIDVFLGVFSGEYTPAYAIAKRWIKLTSETPEGAFYHYTVISKYMGMLVDILRGG